MSFPTQLREIVNGALLAHNIGKNVSLLGQVTNINPNGKSFEMRSVDSHTITVNLSSPLDDMLEGYVEVHGVVQGNNAVRADEYIQFSTQQSEDFDTEGHDKLCALLQQVPDVYKTC